MHKLTVESSSVMLVNGPCPTTWHVTIDLMLYVSFYIVRTVKDWTNNLGCAITILCIAIITQSLVIMKKNQPESLSEQSCADECNVRTKQFHSAQYSRAIAPMRRRVNIWTVVHSIIALAYSLHSGEENVVENEKLLVSTNVTWWEYWFTFVELIDSTIESNGNDWIFSIWPITTRLPIFKYSFSLGIKCK